MAPSFARHEQCGEVSQKELVILSFSWYKAVGQTLELSGGKCKTGKDFFPPCLVNPLVNLLLLDALGAGNN